MTRATLVFHVLASSCCVPVGKSVKGETEEGEGETGEGEEAYGKGNDSGAPVSGTREGLANKIQR